MTTTPVLWTIAAIGFDTATAVSDHTAAWTAALRAARTALLTGDLNTLAVTVGNNHCGALYTPACDKHGHIDPHALTASLIDLHQAATVGELAHFLGD